MKRIITIIIALGLIVPAVAVAVASRVAPGSTRTAIDRAAAPQLPGGIPQRCLVAQVTTKDGGNWAEVGFHGYSCVRWAFSGVVILRRTRGRGSTSQGVLLCSRVDGSAYPSRSVWTCSCHVDEY